MNEVIATIRCPHCGQQDQIQMPICQIITCNCRYCEKLLLIALGTCLPLEQKIFRQASKPTKKRLMLNILAEWLDGAINDCLKDTNASPSGPITEAESKKFQLQEVLDLDDPELFRRIFEED